LISNFKNELIISNDTKLLDDTQRKKQNRKYEYTLITKLMH